MEAVIVCGLSIIPSFSWLLSRCDHLIVSLNAVLFFVLCGETKINKKETQAERKTFHQLSDVQSES